MRLLCSILSCALTLSGCVARAQAPERTTTILGEPRGTTLGDGYCYSGGGCTIDTVNGRVPVAQIGGKACLKIGVTGQGGQWTVGIARAGWVRWYLDDYLPDAALRFDVCGAQGGERLTIGFRDSDKDGPGPDVEVAATVPASKYAQVTTDWQTVRVPLKDLVAAAPDLDLDDCIVALVSSEGDARPQTLYLCNIAFVTTSPERTYPPIKIDQVGYLPDMRKVAKVSAPVDEVKVMDLGTGQAVATVKAGKVADNDPASGDNVWEADFSAVTQPGKYRLEAGGLEPSAPFEVREGVYDALFRDAMRFYYLQRCGTELDAAHAGEYARPACHLGDQHAVTRDGKDPRDVTGGWHDAGDCNKYPCWVKLPIFMMLDLYDLRAGSKVLADGVLGIPESGNGVPDILDEAMWELDWMLKMQIREGDRAGAVYDRIDQSAAPGGSAERLQEERRLLPPTNDSTGACAAAWARAARTLAGIPACREAAARYLEAAKLAYARLQADKAPPTHLLAAAACLYDATGEQEYLDTATALFDRVVGSPTNPQDTDRFIWSVYDCPVATLARSQRDGNGLREKGRAMLAAVADRAVQTAQGDGYSVPIWSLGHYCWSSSQIISKMGYYALLANTYAPRAAYVDLGGDCLHYLLGRNAIDTCFPTRYGTHQTEIYHSIYGHSSTAFLPLPPGIIGGGVNQWESAGISAWPAKNYRGDPNNWTLTEPAIYYNAPLVFLSGYFAGAAGA
jgi:endoglucanase